MEQNKSFKDEMKCRIKQVKYTLRHRGAFRYTERLLFGRVSFESYFHDLDKVFLYPIIGVKRTHNWHRKHSSHHEKASTAKHFQQMVIDWECARITKPDKPLNAYDTLYKYYPEREDDILPILKSLGIDHPTK